MAARGRPRKPARRSRAGAGDLKSYRRRGCRASSRRCFRRASVIDSRRRRAEKLWRRYVRPRRIARWLGRIYDRLQWALGVALLNLFPLPRQSGFRKSFAYAGEAVDRGYSVLVFPEGRHTEDGKLRPFRSGVGLLVNNLRIPVVPMRIDGLFEVKQAGKRIRRVREDSGAHWASQSRLPRSASPEEIAAELHHLVESL